jgi:hypothetical protein
MPAITRVGSATASTNTVTIPAHQAGDLILIWAVRGNSTTAPTLPAGFTSVRSTSNATATAVAGRLGFKVATSSSDTSGTWTNADEICCQVYRPSGDCTISTGASIAGSSAGSTITYPALTLTDLSGNSWLVGLVGISNLVQTMGAPTGMVNQTSVQGALYEAAGHDTNGGVSSWTSHGVASGSTGSSITVVAEITLVLIPAMAVAEAGTTTESAFVSGGVLVSETGTAVESADAVAQAQATAAESGTALDSLALFVASTVAVSDAGTALDSLALSAVVPVAVSEVCAAQDSLGLSAVAPIAIAESGTAIDGFTATLPDTFAISLSETTTVADAVAVSVFASIVATESASAVDTATQFMSVPVSVSENSAILETTDLTSAQFIAAISESAIVFDSIFLDAEPESISVVRFGLLPNDVRLAAMSRDVRTATMSSDIRVAVVAIDNRSSVLPADVRAAIILVDRRANVLAVEI